MAQLADQVTLGADFFSIDEEQIKWMESAATEVDGKVA